MDAETQEGMKAQAIAWRIRLRHGDDAAWDGFAQWLAADPRHAKAYDLVEDADLAIEPHLSRLHFPEAANDTDFVAAPTRRRSGRWGWAGAALAASIVAVAVVAPQLQSHRYQVETGPGERRTVTLDAATQVMLNGSTRMTFDSRNPRFAALDHGEALLRVRHDEARPFVLEVGDNRVRDAGTIFNVVREANQVRVAVSEGAVLYNPGRQAVALKAGQALVDRVDRPISVRGATIASVGAWQDGRLLYAGEPLSQVAADLGRTLGVRIKVAPAIADRPVSGVIVLDGANPETLRPLMAALDVTLETGADGWTMKPGDGARR